MAIRTIEEALKLMRQVGIQPRGPHYFEYLSTLRRAGNSGKSREVIDDMIRNGIRPNTACYEQAIFASLNNRELDETAV